MENKKKMIVFCQTELNNIKYYTYENDGMKIRRLIKEIEDKEGRQIRMEE